MGSKEMCYMYHDYDVRNSDRNQTLTYAHFALMIIVTTVTFLCMLLFC
jgi:hypothetical protein